MSRRLAARSLVALFVVALVSSPGLVAADKGVRVSRYDVEATLDATGTLEVEERVVFVLSGGPFTRVYRQIPMSFADGVEVVSSSGDGRALDGDTLHLVPASDEMLVQWQFPPVSDVTRTWVLRYRLTGAVARDEDGDRLLWTPLPARHDYRIDDSLVVVRWPESSGAAPDVSTRRDEDVRVEVRQEGDVARFVSSRIGRHDDYQIRLAFPPGAFSGGAPAWQERDRAQSARMASYGLGGFGVFALCVVALTLYWWQRRPTWSRPPNTPTLDVPSSLPVALAAALKSGQGRPPSSALWGTLMSLARRGVVSLEPPDGSARAFRVRRGPAAKPAWLHEQVVLAHLFERGAPTGHGGQLVDVTSTSLEAAQRDFRDGVWADLRKAGYIDAQRVSVKTVLWRSTAVMAVVGGLGTLVAGIVGASTSHGVGVMFVPLGLLAAAGVVAMLAAGTSPLSERGLTEGARWRCLAYGLSAAVHTGRRHSAIEWPTMLPIAAAFGLGAAVAQRATGLGVDVPPWFDPRHASRDAASGDDSSWLAFLTGTSAGGEDGGDGGASAGAAGAGGGGSGAD